MFIFNRGSVVILLAAVVLYGLMFAYPEWGAWYDRHENAVILLAVIGIFGWVSWRKATKNRRP